MLLIMLSVKSCHLSTLFALRMTQKFNVQSLIKHIGEIEHHIRLETCSKQIFQKTEI